MQEWTHVAWLGPGRGGFGTDPELRRAMAEFLAERDLSPSRVTDNDIRVDMVYAGPAKRTCDRRLWVRTQALVRPES